MEPTFTRRRPSGMETTSTQPTPSSPTASTPAQNARPRTRLLALGATALAVALAFSVGLLVSGRGGSAVAATTTSMAQLATSTTGNPQGITVVGTATVKGTPDTLRLQMGVNTTRGTVGDALAAANSAAARVFEALKKANVDAKDQQTSGMSIYPQYNSSGSSVTGYAVTENLVVTLRDLKTAGATISAVVAAGGSDTRVDSIGLTIDDTSALLTSARATAVANAKTKAQQYADAAGRPLGNLIDLTESVNQPTPQPYYSEAAAAGGDKLLGAVPIKSGSQDVVVVVTATYAIG